MSEENNTQDITEISDDDFLTNFDALPEPDDETSNNENGKEEENTENQKQYQSGNGTETNPSQEQTGNAGQETLPNGNAQQGQQNTSESASGTSSPNSEGQEGSSTHPDSNPKITAQDTLNAIFAPFKANGTQIQANSTEEVIRLMQQGAGASKRMQELAPKLRMLKSLENNDLLDENKINHLIALASKDPKAIAALVKQAEIEPYDLDLDDAENYVPEDKSVSEREYDVQVYMDNLRQQPMFKETIGAADSWDEESQKSVIDNPQLLGVINGHMQTGVFSQIENIVNAEKMKGNIAQNTPFLEAYNEIGNQLVGMGAIDHSGNIINNEQTSNDGNDPTLNKGNEALNQKRKAAGVTQSTTISNTQNSSEQEELDMLSMSDEEFMKKYGG